MIFELFIAILKLVLLILYKYTFSSFCLLKNNLFMNSYNEAKFKIKNLLIRTSKKLNDYNVIEIIQQKKNGCVDFYFVLLFT